LSKLYVDEIRPKTSGKQVTFPEKPAFSVYLNSSSGLNDYTSGAADIPYDTKDFDVGGNVSLNSNAVFTVPVDGIYQFNSTFLMDNVTGAGYVSSYIYIDGANVGSDPDLSYRAIEDPQGGAYITLTSAQLIQLTAGQTVKPTFYVDNDTTTQVRQGTRFSGFLVA